MKIGIGRNLKALFAKKANNVVDSTVKLVGKDLPKMKVLKEDKFSLISLPQEMQPDSPIYNWDKIYM